MSRSLVPALGRLGLAGDLAGPVTPGGALGPALGSWAMYRLRRSPAAVRLGGEGGPGASGAAWLCGACPPVSNWRNAAT